MKQKLAWSSIIRSIRPLKEFKTWHIYRSVISTTKLHELQIFESNRQFIPNNALLGDVSGTLTSLLSLALGLAKMAENKMTSIP